ncbi:DegV family protein [Paludicola sp. MB14-C6]|uniref:DegV family protein n=1 Tax=Paludihabitans sp. MB14-C6 TaxID=3070656 RepID=UPI0027DC6024|nr:DegV family protein [Paludicola sp. MB14-C6]WMJ23579.1 DegV family protein [Paludicola sp. MB14-C6]
MNKIKIMTDSASDIPKELEEDLDIKILSFPITVGDQGYMERIDFTNEEFYALLLDVPKIPVTSQITSLVFNEEFLEIYKQGYNELIYVAINSKGSNTYQSALLARDMFFEEHPSAKGEFQIHIIDSKTYTMAYGYAVIEAAKKAKKDAKSSEIVGFLEDWFDSVVVYFSPLKLDFAKKSGRISCAAAFVGELIGLKPIIRIMDGEMQILDKVRGEKAVAPALVKLAKETMIPQTPYFTVKGMAEAQSNELIECAEKQIGYQEIGAYLVGSAIAINAGPQVIGIIVKGTNRNIQMK